MDGGVDLDVASKGDEGSIGSIVIFQSDGLLVDAADFTTPGAIKGWLKISIQDDQATNPIVDGDYYIPFYAVPTA